ncbi:MAG: DNA-directed DNA polymerase [Thermoplasmata archaeon]
MGSWDVRLLNASYKEESKGVVVELFGKTRDDRSISIRYEGFYPYFYVVDPPKILIDTFEHDSEVKEMQSVQLWADGEMRNCKQVILHHPWKTPEYRARAKRYCGILAADIPFALRFIFDKDLGSCVRVVGEEVEGPYSTELAVKAEGFEQIEPFNPWLKIMSFDIENSIKDGKIFTICCVTRENGELQDKCFEGSEREIIEGFVDYVKEKDPDVITGYNIDGYDIPLLRDRARKNAIPELYLSRNDVPLREGGARFWRIYGRIVADAWWNAKRELRPKQETLDHVARLVLGEGKRDVDPSKIDEEWEKDKEKVMRYCKKDAQLALRILESIGVLEKSMDLAIVSKLPVDYVLNGRTSTLIDSILIRTADRANVGVPMTRTGRRGESIEGGYVHTIPSGLYHWVCVLDFKAMYPNLIIANNICFTTLSDEGTISSPTGAKFLSKDEKLGLLPNILSNLMKQRDEAKAQMREAEGDKRKYYDGLQDAIKILMNAFYGVFASSFYRFTNPKIGATITAIARENTKSVISQLEDEGLRVIYGDTDSVFFQSPEEGVDSSVRIGEGIAERFSKGGAILEFEKVLEPFFSHGRKKRYVGKVVWPEEDLLVRGYELRRTDAFDLQSEGQAMLFERIMENDIDGAIRIARDLVSDAREGKVPFEKLVISRTVRDEKSYVSPDALPNVQAARKLREWGYEVVPGMKVSWIVTDGKKAPQQISPYVSGREFEDTPDWNYYARRLAHTLGYVTEVFGWDEKSLLAGSQQVTLFHEDFGTKRNTDVKVKKTEKKLTLEDFM